jgi:hypothetical protein
LVLPMLKRAEPAVFGMTPSWHSISLISRTLRPFILRVLLSLSCLRSSYNKLRNAHLPLIIKKIIIKVNNECPTASVPVELSAQAETHLAHAKSVR